MEEYWNDLYKKFNYKPDVLDKINNIKYRRLRNKLIETYNECNNVNKKCKYLETNLKVKNEIKINDKEINVYYSNYIEPRCDRCGKVELKHKCKKIVLICPCGLKTICKNKYYEHKCKYINNKPYVCNICNAAILIKKNFNRHMLKHNSEKIIKCDKCSYETYRKDNMKRHTNKMH